MDSKFTRSRKLCGKTSTNYYRFVIDGESFFASRFDPYLLGLIHRCNYQKLKTVMLVQSRWHSWRILLKVLKGRYDSEVHNGVHVPAPREPAGFSREERSGLGTTLASRHTDKQAEEASGRSPESTDKKDLSSAPEENTMANKTSEPKVRLHVENPIIDQSYSGEFVSTQELSQSFTAAKTEVAQFTWQFAKCLMDRFRMDALLFSWDGERVVYAQESHAVNHGVKARINKVLYKDFEYEDFFGGFSETLDDKARSMLFTNYYRQQDVAVAQDEKFSQFLERKSNKLTKTFGIFTSAEVSNLKGDAALDKMGGPYLAEEFRHLAKSIWLLHKGTFACKSPPTIFKVARNAGVNYFWMDSVERDDNPNPRVGFTVTPGFRFGGTELVFRAEIYPLFSPQDVKDI